jgi:hypothetical protein
MSDWIKGNLCVSDMAALRRRETALSAAGRFPT